jgi:hypothetical protein
MACKICKSALMDNIDLMLNEGKSLKEISEYAKSSGLSASIDNVSKHRKCVRKREFLGSSDVPKDIASRIEFLINQAFLHYDKFAGSYTIQVLVKLLEMQKDSCPKQFTFEIKGAKEYSKIVKAMHQLSEEAKKEFAGLLNKIDMEEKEGIED